MGFGGRVENYVSDRGNYEGWINKKQGVYSEKQYDSKLTVFEMDGVV